MVDESQVTPDLYPYRKVTQRHRQSPYTEEVEEKEAKIRAKELKLKP